MCYVGDVMVKHLPYLASLFVCHITEETQREGAEQNVICTIKLHTAWVSTQDAGLVAHLNEASCIALGKIECIHGCLQFDSAGPLCVHAGCNDLTQLPVLLFNCLHLLLVSLLG